MHKTVEEEGDIKQNSASCWILEFRGGGGGVLKKATQFWREQFRFLFAVNKL